MIEIFKTDVKNNEQANLLIEQIHREFTNYRANFDLEDCDNILRVTSNDEKIQSNGLIKLLRGAGYCAEVLPDIIELPVNTD